MKPLGHIVMTQRANTLAIAPSVAAAAPRLAVD